jgi:hypothetical protein
VSAATHQGNVHDYLGMILDFSKKRKVMVTMIEYIKNIVANFPKEIIGLKPSSAADHLFKVWEELKPKPLPEEQAMVFDRHTTLQLLFFSAHARQDIQPTTAFLMTRVKSPDEDDWVKSNQCLGI